MPHRDGWGKGGGARGSKTFKHLSLSHTDCHTKRDFDPHHLVHDLKGIMALMDILNLWYRDNFLHPLTSADMRGWFRPLTIMCCNHRGPREANIHYTWPPIEATL